MSDTLQGKIDSISFNQWPGKLRPEIDKAIQELREQIIAKAEENNWYIGNAIEEHRIIKLSDVLALLGTKDNL